MTSNHFAVLGCNNTLQWPVVIWSRSGANSKSRSCSIRSNLTTEAVELVIADQQRW